MLTHKEATLAALTADYEQRIQLLEELVALLKKENYDLRRQNANLAMVMMQLKKIARDIFAECGHLN